MCGCFIVKHIWIGVQKQGKWSNWPVGDVDDTSGALEKSDNIQVYQPHSEVPRPCYVVEGLSCVTSAELFQNRCRSWLQFKHTCFWNRKMLVSNPFRTVSARIGTILETWLEASWSPSLTYAENQRFWEYKSANTTKTTFSWRSFPCLSKVFPDTSCLPQLRAKVQFVKSRSSRNPILTYCCLHIVHTCLWTSCWDINVNKGKCTWKWPTAESLSWYTIM